MIGSTWIMYSSLMNIQEERYRADWLGTHPSLSPGGQANVNGSPSRTTWSSPEEGGHCDQEKKERDVGQTKMLHDPTDSEGTEQDP